MRVLVTGATGFVGFAVATELLNVGHEVVALTRSARDLPPGVRPVAGDLLTPESVAEVIRQTDPDAVCHLAALARVRDSRVEPLRYWRTNVGGTLSLLDALTARKSPTLLVAASTCAVYGERAIQPIADEQPSCPTNPYARSKLAADHVIADVAATGAVGAVSLRAFNVAGGLPGHADGDETRLIPKLVAVAQGRAPELIVNGDGSTVRDFLHVADMADAFVRALTACQPGRWVGYNVGSGQRSTISDVVGAAEQVVGARLPIRHNPPVDEPRVLLADPSRFAADLAWRPWRSELRQIVEDAWTAAHTAYS